MSKPDTPPERRSKPEDMPEHIAAPWPWLVSRPQNEDDGAHRQLVDSLWNDDDYDVTRDGFV